MTITNIGDATFLSCALLIALHNHKRLLTNAVICGVFIHYTIKFTKNIFAVLRPEHTLDLTNLITLGPALKLDNYAMPSGHTASAFMAVIFIASAYQLRSWKLWLLISYACLVGISRIAVGAHWPADVFAGAVIGIFFGLLCTHEKWNITHIAVQYLTLALYLPFIYIAIHRVKSIHDATSLINEGAMVLAGILGLAIWLLSVKSHFNKKTPLLTTE
ncbi:phosphatase PAP2 family protein [Cellvibrio zantedeschiae]|nr:phosphatase PAP2 family protein [Cellvibrio zantedeschiae]